MSIINEKTSNMLLVGCTFWSITKIVINLNKQEKYIISLYKKFSGDYI